MHLFIAVFCFTNSNMIGMASDAMAVLLVISVMAAMIRHTNRFMTHGSRKSNTVSLHPIHEDSPDFYNIQYEQYRRCSIGLASTF